MELAPLKKCLNGSRPLLNNLVKTPAEIENMRKSGKILGEILRVLSKAIKAGMKTKELDDLASSELKKHDAEAAFLGYQGFPASLCVSINEEIVHGIPGERVLGEGDIVGLDFGVKYKGMITDGAVTVGVGEVSHPARQLLEDTHDALYDAIAVIKPGIMIGDVSYAIEETLTSTGLSVVEGLSGHGVGRELHEDPEVPNFGRPGTGPKLQAGMTIAVEPMASTGKGKIKIADDGWTVETADGSLAAQFEHTVLVTESGCEILTN